MRRRSAANGPAIAIQPAVPPSGRRLFEGGPEKTWRVPVHRPASRRQHDNTSICASGFWLDWQHWTIRTLSMGRSARFGFGPGFFTGSCLFIWGSLRIGNVRGRNRRSFVMSNLKSGVISRRKALSLLGLATLGLTVPATLLTVSDAEAQAQQPAPAAPVTGTERRQERRTGRVKRRTGRRAARRKGRGERSELRRKGEEEKK